MYRRHVHYALCGLVLAGLGALSMNSEASPRMVEAPAAQAVESERLAQQEDDEGLWLFGQIGGPTLAMAVDRHRLLVGVGAHVYAFHVWEDGASLDQMSRVLPGIVRDIQVRDDKVYVAAGHLVTLGADEFGNITTDEQRFTPPEDRRVSAIAFHDDRIYAATMGNELSDRGELYVLSNEPERRFEVASSQDSGGIVRRIEIAGDTAYLVYAFGGVSAVDLSDAASPTLLGVDRQFQDMSAQDDRRAAVWDDKILYWEAGLPADAEPSAEITVPGLAGQQVHLDADGVLAAGEHGMVVRVPFDGSGGFGVPEEQAAGDAETSLLFTDLASDEEFYFTSLADLPALEGLYPSELLRMGAMVKAYFKTEARHHLVIDGPSLWQTDWMPGLPGWSVEGGRDPHFRPRVWSHIFGELSTEREFEGIDGRGAYAPAITGIGYLIALALRPGEVQLYDNSGVEWPVVLELVSTIDVQLHEGPAVMRSSENMLYVGQDDIQRVDIRDPAEPRNLEPSHPAGGVRDFELVGNRAYVASKDGFGVIDLAAPPPAEQPPGRWLDGLDDSIGVEVSRDIAFVTGQDPMRGLTAVSLSNSEGLEIIGQLPGPIGDVSLFDNQRYVAVASLERIWIVDVSSPERMQIVWEFPIPRYAAEGWGSGHVFPTLEELESDSRILVFPRVHVYGDLLFYMGPMAGILGYEMISDWAFQPRLVRDIYLPVLLNSSEARSPE